MGRLVSAQRKLSRASIYLISNQTSPNLEDETWEFLPGSRVVVATKILSGEQKLVAVALSP